MQGRNLSDVLADPSQSLKDVLVRADNEKEPKVFMEPIRLLCSSPRFFLDPGQLNFKVTHLGSLLGQVIGTFLKFLLIHLLQVFEFVFIARLLLALLEGAVLESTKLVQFLVEHTCSLLVLLHICLVPVTFLSDL